ncbi:Transcriptional regulator, LysR family [plant metagenome]|uniref:Transcriptional regulator, LysR family n=1 Tax=plant metagenome TaxID=1297885 RepID=A0A484U0Z8_9ZZZZ
MSMDELADEVADIFLLTVLAQTRSFTQAAKRLGLSKASVSGRIGALERRVGTPLVRRSTRAVSLTQAGQVLADGAASGFAAVQDSLSRVRDLADQPRGLVKLTAPVAFGRQHLAPLLTPFLMEHPDINVELDLSDRFVNLESEGFDLAIRHAGEAPPAYVAWPLAQTATHLLASSRYLGRHGTPAQPEDLLTHACLPYLRNGGAATWTFQCERGPRKGERVNVPVRGRFKANNSEVLRGALLGGLGIGLLPDFSLPTGRDARTLRPVLPDWSVQGFFGETIYAMRPWSASVPQAVRSLVDFLREHLPGQLENGRSDTRQQQN